MSRALLAILFASSCSLPALAESPDDFDYGEADILFEEEPDLVQRPGYFAWKERLREDYGLRYVIEDGLIFQVSPDSGGVAHADNELNFMGEWLAIENRQLGRGAVFWWFQNATTLGSVTTSEMQERLGIVSPPNGGDTAPDSSATRLQHLAWEQRTLDESARVEIGKLTTRILLNANRYASGDREDFFTPMIVNNPVVPYTARLGLGGFAQVRRDLWYLSLFARAPDGEDWIDFDAIQSGDWEYATEFALTPTLPRFGLGHYRITYHYTDAIQALGQPAGWDISFSFDQDVGPRVGAFFRYAFADKPFRAFEQRLAGGFQLKGIAGRPDDRIGFGTWWGDTTDPSIPNETGLEVFWRIQANELLQVTPDVQFIFDPARSDESVVTIFGLRGRTLL